ncbi:MAG: VWA domain-containing protein, partial [Longimicrobiales bacterium]
FAGGAPAGPVLRVPTPTEPRIQPEPAERARAGQARDQAGVVAPISFTLIVEDGGRFRDAFSPTHDVRVTRDGGRMTVRPRDTLAGDLSLFLPLAGERVGITLATHRPSSENGYFMLTLSPGAVDASTMPRDVTVVVDVSGSMSGEKIEQAKGAVRQLLGTLSPEDRFRLIRFSSGVESYRADWTAASADAVRAAREWVEALSAGGGTNIAGALDETFRATSSESRLPVVVFMTDGEPTVGETNPEHIAQRAEAVAGRARVFAFGVGYDVNTVLLDGLGAVTRGTAQYVEPGEDVERAVGLLAGKIRHPVLADLDIDDSPVRFVEVYPERLPDLFAGEELVIFGRYAGRGDGSLTITGRRNGRAERYATRARFADHETDNGFIPRLWASRKLGVLAQQVRLNGADPELIDEIRNTALRYGLLSEYTSYLVQEPQLAAASRDELFQRVAPEFAAMAAGGEAAVRRAERQRADRDARTLDGVAEAQRVTLESLVVRGSATAGRSPGRSVAGRVFREEDSAWVDALHRPDLRVIDIEPFSAAYFALLRRLPELESYWADMSSVLVAGREVSIRVSTGGKTQFSGSEIAQVIEAFRFGAT